MIVKNLVVANGEYSTHDGKTKTRWKTIGHRHTHEGKEYLTLDRSINLAGLHFKEGETRIYVNEFEPDDKHDRATFIPKEKTPPEDFDDDLPF